MPRLRLVADTEELETRRVARHPMPRKRLSRVAEEAGARVAPGPLTPLPARHDWQTRRGTGWPCGY